MEVFVKSGPLARFGMFLITWACKIFIWLIVKLGATLLHIIRNPAPAACMIFGLVIIMSAGEERGLDIIISWFLGSMYVCTGFVCASLDAVVVALEKKDKK